MGAVIDVAVPLIAFVLLTAVGTDLRTADFKALLRRPGVVAAGLLGPPLLLPPLALGLIALFDPPLATAVGLVLIASCPVGGISNAFSYLARASTALSVTLTAASCLLAIVTIPVIGTLFGRWLHRPFIGEVPGALLLAQLFVTVLLPVSLGMVVRHRWPEVADRHRTPLQRVAFVLLALLLGLIVLDDVRGFVAGLSHTVPLAAVFVAGSFAVGGGVAHAVGAALSDRVTLAIEFATRNVAVATMLAVTLLGRAEFATFAATYFLTELPLMTGAAVVFRRILARAPGGRPEAAPG